VEDADRRKKLGGAMPRTGKNYIRDGCNLTPLTSQP